MAARQGPRLGKQLLLTSFGSYVVSQDIYWFETVYGKCLHKRTNERSNHYMRRGVTGNTTYLGKFLLTEQFLH